MSEIPNGVTITPEERRKAQTFFEHGRAKADIGSFDYGIELYLNGLNHDPTSLDAYQSIRETALRRKASGGKDLGILDKSRLRKIGKDEKVNLINYAKLLAYDPGNVDAMIQLTQAAIRFGVLDVGTWWAFVAAKANGDSGKENRDVWLSLKDAFKDLKMWKQAADCAQAALRMKPDMDLQTEIKHIAAQQTMTDGNYSGNSTFRDSVRDASKQQDLQDQDKDIRSIDGMARAIAAAEAELATDPSDVTKLMKLVDVLEKTDDSEYEGRAVDLLQHQYEKSKQFRFRWRVGQINMRQMNRMERSMRAALQATPDDEHLKKDYEDFRKDLLELELKENQLASEAYPTENSYRAAIGSRLFQLGRFEQAIPVLQNVRNDPKYKTEAGVLLGRAFFENQFYDETVDTFDQLITEYQGRGDARSKEMFYWRGRALEANKSFEPAIKSYSQLAQWDFNYKDVQSRIKSLRAMPKASGNTDNA